MLYILFIVQRMTETMLSIVSWNIPSIYINTDLVRRLTLIMSSVISPTVDNATINQDTVHLLTFYIYCLMQTVSATFPLSI